MANPTAHERAERILSSEEVLDTFSGCTISREKVEREILAAERAAAREAVEEAFVAGYHVAKSRWDGNNDGDLDADGRPIAMLLTEWSELFAALRNAAPALIAVAKAAREWRQAYLADDDGDSDERPFITRLDTAGGNLCDAIRAMVGEE